MILKEAWHREILSLEVFKPAKPKPDQDFESWFREQYHAYKKWLGLEPQVQFGFDELGRLRGNLQAFWGKYKGQEKREKIRHWEQTRKRRLQEDPAYREEYLRRKREYNKRYREDLKEMDPAKPKAPRKPTYEEMTPEERAQRNKELKEKRKQKFQEQPGLERKHKQREKDRRKRKYELHKKRMQEDPEYAKAYREKMLEQKRKNNKKRREQHKKRMLEDPAYREDYLEKQRQYNKDYRKRNLLV